MSSFKTHSKQGDQAAGLWAVGVKYFKLHVRFPFNNLRLFKAI